jgi:hypothetical protein
MSTERKPGSRGAREPFDQGRAKPASPFGTEPGARETPKTKGTTKTVSPRESYKKRKPRK